MKEILGLKSGHRSKNPDRFEYFGLSARLDELSICFHVGMGLSDSFAAMGVNLPNYGDEKNGALPGCGKQAAFVYKYTC